jgi:hypothetical protein
MRGVYEPTKHSCSLAQVSQPNPFQGRPATKLLLSGHSLGNIVTEIFSPDAQAALRKLVDNKEQIMQETLRGTLMIY